MRYVDQRGDCSYSVVLIDSLERWADIAKCWDDLLSQSRSNTVFLTWEWLYSWVECFLGSDRRLFILTVYKGGELIGVAPWCIRQTRLWGQRIRSVEFLGTPEAGSDYLDVFARPKTERDVTRVLYHYLFERASSLWDKLLLSDMPANSLFLLYFLNQIEEAGKHVELHSGSFCPTVALPAKREQFLAQLSTNRKKQYLRDSRLLSREEECTFCTVESEAISEALESLKALYTKRWDAHELLFTFLSKILSRCHASNWIQINTLHVRDKIIAAVFHIQYFGTKYCYLLTVDRSYKSNVNMSLGNVLVGLSIEQAIAEGLSTYDFLKGCEEYKFYWADTGKRSLNLVLYRRRVGLVVELIGKHINTIAKVLLR